jgi:hypothetical protein
MDWGNQLDEIEGGGYLNIYVKKIAAKNRFLEV